MISRTALVASLAMLALPTCDAVAPLPADPVYTVALTPVAATLAEVGQTLRFTALARDIDHEVVTGAVFMWTSQDPAVATVDAVGTATARRSGTTIVTARAQGVEGSATLTIAP